MCLRSMSVLGIMLLVFLSACSAKQDVMLPLPAYDIKTAKTAAPVTHTPVYTPSSSVRLFMQMAHEDRRVDEALAGLSRLISNAPAGLAEEAAFRRIQLLLQFEYPRAMEEAEALLVRRPNHRLTPFLHVWLAEWWSVRQNDAQVLAHTMAALSHPLKNEESVNQATNTGLAAARRSPDHEAVQWFFQAAKANTEQGDFWLMQAASRSSLEIIHQMHDAGTLQNRTGAQFYINAARNFQIRGDDHAVQSIVTMMHQDVPDASALNTLRQWTNRRTSTVTLGVMLPLSGRYARYGMNALHGIRLALSMSEYARHITLRIADTASTPETCPDAYQSLLDDRVAMIIGPLLSTCTRSLIPHLLADTPIISLSSHIEMAGAAEPLFIHTLSLTSQARFAAQHAWNEGMQRMVLVNTPKSASQEEATAFRQAFEALGGEILYQMTLPASTVDFRADLRALRAKTDDEELLAKLDEDLALSVEPDQEIHIPVHFDAMYLSLPGREVALLAGQLAYIGINKTRLYGSTHWRDGHLLDDNGRYMQGARFTDVVFPDGNSPSLRKLLLAWHETWGETMPSKMVGLAYDSTLIAAMISSRMGLKGRAAIQMMHDATGFPGVTGQVRFDVQGLGHKSFEIFTIKRGHIIPAG